MDKLAAITHTVPLGEAPAMGRHILKGIVRGRTVIDVNS